MCIIKHSSCKLYLSDSDRKIYSYHICSKSFKLQEITRVNYILPQKLANFKKFCSIKITIITKNLFYKPNILLAKYLSPGNKNNLLIAIKYLFPVLMQGNFKAVVNSID